MKKLFINTLAFGLCPVLLLFRLTMGVDLSDESYYATFIDGWLKNGLHDNPNLMIHQTAEILIYPLAVIYNKLYGSEEGLILFLRTIYLAIASLSSFCLYLAVAPHHGKRAAYMTASFALLFIPFGLPAPSYNTLGMFSMVGALSLFSLSFGTQSLPTSLRSSSYLSGKLWLSAIWWTVACLAYPTIFASLIVLFALGFAVLRLTGERQLMLRYLLCCGILIFITLAILIFTLGTEHLWDSVRFTNAAVNISGGLSRKVKSAVDLFVRNPRFAGLTALAILIALASAFVPSGSKMERVTVAAVGLLVLGAATSEQPTLYIRSHDLVFLIAVSGIGVAFRNFKDRGAHSGKRITGAIYFVSLMGGFVTAATAYNGLLNYPVGGLFAACLSVSMLTPMLTEKNTESPASVENLMGRVKTAISLAVPLLACCAMAATSLTYYYGGWEKISHRESILIHDGIFAGLRTGPITAKYITEMTKAIQDQSKCGNKIAGFGNVVPGNYLLTPMTPSTLATFNITNRNYRNFATDAQDAFYSIPANRPDVIVVNVGPWASPLFSDSENNLLKQYVLDKRVSVGVFSALIYRRADCQL